MAGRQMQSGIPGRPIKSRPYAFLLIGALLVIVVAISARATVGNASPNGPRLVAADQSPAPTPVVQPAAKPTTTPIAKVGADTTGMSGGPRISFSEKSFDFGTIAQGSKVSHTFVVRNDGKAPLRLIKAAGS